MQEKHYLRCDFSEAELKDFSKELARSTSQLAQAEEEKKAAMAQFTERMASQKATLSGLARKINEGYEMRMVDCAVALDTPSKGRASITRTDTGEIIKERDMNGTELQRELPIGDAMEAFADEVNSGALNGDGITVTATVGKK